MCGLRLMQSSFVCFGDSAAADRPAMEQKQLTNWFLAGSLSLGPVHLNARAVPEHPKHSAWQSAFLRRHDERTKRLWFLWPSMMTEQPPPDDLVSGDSPAAAFTPSSNYISPSIVQNCGCYGQCSFFGRNLSGHQLFRELSTGRFHHRAVFPPRSAYQPELFTGVDESQWGGNGIGQRYVEYWRCCVHWCFCSFAYA